MGGGPNDGGTLILHANTSLVYTSDPTNWCGQAGLTACSLATVTLPLDPEAVRVFYALAAFPEGSSPRLKALAFGIDWDPARFVLLGSGPCGDDPFEIKDDGWPNPGTGVGMSWPATRSGLLSEIYWYAGYSYSASDTTSFALTPHPVQGGQFADDAGPPNVDEIVGYGRLGFGVTGDLPCPQAFGGGGDSGEPDGAGGVEVPGDPDSPGGIGGPEEPDGAGDQGGGGGAGPMDMPMETISLWVEVGSIDFGGDPWTPRAIAAVPGMNASLRTALLSAGAVSIVPQFPARHENRRQTLDWRGDPIELVDLTGYYRVAFANSDAAAAAVFGLETPGVVKSADQETAAPVANLDDLDPYSEAFPQLDWNCTKYAGPDSIYCNLHPGWHLRNDGPGRPSTAPSCRLAVAGEDVKLPGAVWPDPRPYPALVTIGMVDTGLLDDHEDLHVLPLNQWQKVRLHNNPSSDWCTDHGTKMAGLAAARANGIGVMGVCPGCYLLDLESCSPGFCASCENLTGWETRIDNAMADSVGVSPRPRVLNIEAGYLGFQNTARVKSLWNAFQQGAIAVAPYADTARTQAPELRHPAAIPFVLGVAGFTHDGRFWDYNTSCTHTLHGNLAGSSAGPGIDISAPASPSMVTTVPTPDPETGYYGWTRGENSGACAMVSGALGYLTLRWEYEYGYDPPLGKRPSPDDYVGILKGTARPWEYDPSDSSYCDSCTVADFGAGKLDIAKAWYVLETLFATDRETFLNAHNIPVGWFDPGVVIDSVDVPYEPYREYRVRKLVPIPPTGMAGFPEYLAWPNLLPTDVEPFFGWHTTTSVLSYHSPQGTTTTWRNQWDLDSIGVRGCELEPEEGRVGFRMLIGHNLAKRIPRPGLPDSLLYAVRPEDFWMTYTVVTSLWADQMSVGEPARARPHRPSIELGRNPTDGLQSVRLRTEDATELRLSVFGVSGREVAVLHDGRLDPGRHTLDCERAWPRRMQHAGVYWVVARASGGSSTRKLLILR